MLSKRADVARDWEDFLFKYLELCSDSPYDEENNVNGYVNLGTAVNNLSNDLLHPRLTSDTVWCCDVSLLEYKEGFGTLRLREALAKVVTELFQTHQPIDPENLFCLTGATSCIDLLAHCLGDPDDVFLSVAPMYSRIMTDFKQRSLVEILPIHIISENNNEDFPVLTLEKVILAYKQAIGKNYVVRGVFLINPSNPLGDIYSPQLLMDIMIFCKEHSLHIIVDEVYALSVFSETEKFHSVLRFPKLPDPDRTHVLYGLSKDFCLAGLRIGVIHTTCEQLKKCLIQLCFFQNIPFPLMEIVARFLENMEWLKNFVKINQQRLAERFNFSCNYLKGIGVNVRDSSAGIFLWIDLTNMIKSFEQEKKFFDYLIEKEHLYLNPGEEFLCAQPGWFRMVFSQSPQLVKEGLKRFARAVKEYEPSNA